MNKDGFISVIEELPEEGLICRVQTPSEKWSGFLSEQYYPVKLSKNDPEGFFRMVWIYKSGLFAAPVTPNDMWLYE